MNQNIIEDIGENYQYLKIIIDNRIKILKLKTLDYLYHKIGKIVLITITIVSTLLVLIGFLIALSLWIGSKIDSSSLGFIIGFGILIPVNLIIFLLRKPMIYRPIANKFVKEFITNERTND